ncbi:hypothetical protein HMPREF0484_3407 [Klebsiella pneumoniae subsp. rhinoscleromatis ATCC 13884]|nr:hypothetical protein HMPREF0484_3407 [Klebsiella pneumoniae subsp. rhinoscleromatis ATCC 13884]
MFTFCLFLVRTEKTLILLRTVLRTANQNPLTAQASLLFLSRYWCGF